MRVACPPTTWEDILKPTLKSLRAELNLILRSHGCRDSMSGEEFETTVVLLLDGRPLRGCGRPLH
jgi:uncharacterized membrane protein